LPFLSVQAGDKQLPFYMNVNAKIHTPHEHAVCRFGCNAAKFQLQALDAGISPCLIQLRPRRRFLGVKFNLNFPMKHANIHIPFAWIAVFLMLCGNHFYAHATTSASPDKIIRQALTEHFASRYTDSSLYETPITSVHAKTIIHKNLDSTLLTSAIKIIGSDFQFIDPEQQIETQVAILMVYYSDEKTALNALKKISARDGYFKNAKILTRFSCVLDENRLIIFFTENSGNEEAVKFIDQLPILFKKSK
jgi:hypothetical protein